MPTCAFVKEVAVMRAIRIHSLVAVLVLSVTASGCYDVEVEIPVVTQPATIFGNVVLNKANTKLTGPLLPPSRIEAGLGLDQGDVTSMALTSFDVRLAGASSADEELSLDFVDSAVLYVRSTMDGSDLPEMAIAWFYRDEDSGTATADLIDFEVDSAIELLPYLEEGFELFTSSSGYVPATDVIIEGVAVFGAIATADASL